MYKTKLNDPKNPLFPRIKIRLNQQIRAVTSHHTVNEMKIFLYTNRVYTKEK